MSHIGNVDKPSKATKSNKAKVRLTDCHLCITVPEKPVVEQKEESVQNEHRDEAPQLVAEEIKQTEGFYNPVDGKYYTCSDDVWATNQTGETDLKPEEKSVHISSDLGAYVRVINNVVGTKLDVSVNGKHPEAWIGIMYKRVTKNIAVPEGKHKITVGIPKTCRTDEQEELEGIFQFDADRRYTLILHGRCGDESLPITAILLRDSDKCPSKNQSMVRFVHAAAGAPAVDVAAQKGSGPIKTLYSNVSYGNMGHPNHLIIPSGSYNLYVFPSGVEKIANNALIKTRVTIGCKYIYNVIASGSLTDKGHPLSVVGVFNNRCV